MAINEQVIIDKRENDERLKRDSLLNKAEPVNRIWESIEKIIDGLSEICKNKTKYKDDDWIVMSLSYPYNLVFKKNSECIILSNSCAIYNADKYGICICYSTNNYNNNLGNGASKIIDYYKINDNALELVIENILMGRNIIQGLNKIGDNKVVITIIDCILDFCGIKSLK